MDCIVNEPDPICQPFFDKFVDLWSRPNQPQCFGAYVRGLLAQMDRKNVEAISNRTVGQPYQGLHHFLTESPWDAARLNRRRVELLEADARTRSRPKGVLVLDDSGVPKKGEATQGVKRQYMGQLGKVANGQVFVTSHYAEERCHWPVDLLPYVPDNWLEGGKADAAFRTKLQLALELADRAVAWGVRFRAIVADAWYGRNAGFIKALEERSLPYVVELEAAQEDLRPPGGRHSVQRAPAKRGPEPTSAEGLPPRAHQVRRRHGTGSIRGRPEGEDQEAAGKAPRRGGDALSRGARGRRGPALPSDQREAASQRDGGQTLRIAQLGGGLLPGGQV